MIIYSFYSLSARPAAKHNGNQIADETGPALNESLVRNETKQNQRLEDRMK